ncbi:hypothetical protein B0H34DRAFT_703013 [Crassisporium funariophilum]|nr:hypothetical protein B0H34DRAFT_703013 [Crassisporium funariophilum]
MSKATKITRYIALDDRSDKIQYRGPWVLNDGIDHDTRGNFGPTFRGTLHAASADASLSYAFTGTEATIIGTNFINNETGVYDPTWKCFLDDVETKPTDFFGFPENNWSFCEWDNIANGSHVVSLNVTSHGHTFYFDSLTYNPSVNLNSSQIGESLLVLNTDSGFKYGGNWTVHERGMLTNEFGATAKFPFYGTSVSAYGYSPTELAQGASSAKYTIDEGPPVAFEVQGTAVGGPTGFNTRYFETANVTLGMHTLTITHTGNAGQIPLILGTLYIHNDLDPTGIKSTRSEPKPLVGAIAGAAGGFVVIVIGVIIFIVWYRRRNRPTAVDYEETSHVQPYYMAVPSTSPPLQYAPVVQVPTNTTFPASKRGPYNTSSTTLPVSERTQNITATSSTTLPVSERTQNNIALVSSKRSPPVHQTQPSTSSLSTGDQTMMVVTYQDSGLRLPDNAVQVDEEPPMYSPGPR